MRAILLSCLIIFWLPVCSTAQKQIIVKAVPSTISIRKGMDNNDFHIVITVVNNSDTTIKIPRYESNIGEIHMKAPRLKGNYFEVLAFDDLLSDHPDQIVRSGDSAKIRVLVIGTLFKKTGRNKVSFFVPMTQLRTETPVRLESNKLVVNVE